ncbi:MAG: 2OG-Fe(II) oxygenase [Myxococcota bacterium]
MADFWIERERLTGAGELAEALLGSPLLKDSPLRGTFSASRGFAFTLKSSGLATLRAKHPTLNRFLDRALDRRVRSQLRRGGWRPRVANAWYLNVLLVPPGASVGTHVDVTLRDASGVPDAAPELVSVAHLIQSEGGALRLARGDRPVARLEPRAGRMLHFRGELVHAVDAVTGSEARLSLVMEHYRFDRSALARLPEFETHSRTDFGALLVNGR